MTALAVLLDENGVAYIAADGLMTGRDGRRRDEFAVKTARINDNVAVGFSGDVGYGNQLLAHLFKHSELAQCEDRIDLCALLEACDVTVPGGTYEGARDWISWQLLAWKSDWDAKGEEIPDLNVALAGISEQGARFSVWHCAHDWRIEQCGIWEPGCMFGYPLGPMADGEAKAALKNKAKTPPNRLRDCVRVFAKKRPETVNRNVLIRSSDSGFRMNRTKWPLSEGIQWPNADLTAR
ncbi:MAG: hypothetical protein PHV11_03340 [Candidatus Bipolaricaulis sp.]|nr:hypothetical protein [Candidatus Bipolaricaulis sp.]